MTPERWRQIKDALEIALEQPTQKRLVAVDEICGADADLRTEVLSLLDYQEFENGFLEEENLAAINSAEDFSNDFCGKRIGKYEIVEEIGAGGMGTIFAARRADGEFERTVAVKFLRQGFSSKDARRRFAQERQILADLKHPFIAQMIDGGATEDGAPYLVMELVEGVSITQYAIENRLSLDEKLDLFRNVCRAVSFAHQNFIVHRDLKPDNILITADGTPKLLDFGIAKLVSESANDLTQTRFQAFTPDYAAPEQLTNQLISAASDVYSLGVILYELICGAKPYKITGSDSLAQINSLFEIEPMKPSAVSSKFKIQSPKIKENHVSEKQPTTNDKPTNNPKFKIRNLKSFNGDLDTIILKALKKNPAERYASVEKFADDIRRFQIGLPISARLDTFRYRASKFIKRNKIATVAAVLIFAALAFGIGIALYQAQIARAESRRAEQRFEETREIAKAVIFNYYEEINKLSGATKVRSMMISDALKYLDNLAADESAVGNQELRLELAEGYLRLGDVQGQPYGENLGDSDGAFISYTKALNLFETAPEKESSIADLKTRAAIFQKMSQILIRRETNRESAVEYARRAVETRRKVAALEPNTANKIEIAKAVFNQGWLIGTTGKLPASIPVLQNALTIVDELLQAEPDNLELQKLQGRYNGRIAFHLSMAASQATLFWDETKRREFLETSVPYFEKSIESARKISAAQPEDKAARRSVTVNESNFAEVLAQLGRAREALNLQLKSLDYAKQQFSTDASNQEIKFEIAEDYLDLARTFVYLNDGKQARENLERGMNLLDELIKADPKNTEFPEFQFANYTDLIGSAQIKTGDFEGALNSYNRALEKTLNYAADLPDVRQHRLSLIKKGFGDIYRFRAEKEIGAPRAKDFLAACDFYRQSRDLIAPANALYKETLDYLNEKIAKCEAAR